MGNILDVKIKNFYDCGFCKEKEMEVFVPWEMFCKWQFLMKKFSGKEWGGVCDVDKKGILGNFRIPEQEITTTSVEFKEDIKCDCYIHSHHKMGAFHSGQDDKEFRNLTNLSIVISDNDICGSYRTKLPCGGFGYYTAKINIMEMPDKIMGIEKIKEKTYVYTDYGQQYGFQQEWQKSTEERWKGGNRAYNIDDLDEWRQHLKDQKEIEIPLSFEEEKDLEKDITDCYMCRTYDCENCTVLQLSQSDFWGDF